MICNITLKDSCVRIQLLLIKIILRDVHSHINIAVKASLGGFEQPTFRLTAERAKILRHRDCFQIPAKFSKNLYYFRIHIYYFEIL